MSYHVRGLIIATSLALSFQAQAITITTTTINFDGLADSSAVGNAYSSSGVHFNHAIALTAGVSLNEIQFPPHSGTGVIFDDGSPMVITFDTPVFNISGYFAYLNLLTFSAFDGNGGLLGTLNSPLTSFTGGNQLISLGFSGVSSLRISAQSPSTYVLDDLTFQGGPGTPAVPDAGSTWPLLAMSSLALCFGATLVQRNSNKHLAVSPVRNGD